MSVTLKIFSVMSAGLVLLSSGTFFAGLVSVLYGHSLIIEWEILSASSSLVSMSLVFDWMSFFFLSAVCLISGSVMKYSSYYMEGDLNFMRFIFILLMFVISMWLLIISPNMVSLLLGWDGLGLTSYALVIYYQNELSCNAGMLTVLSNRIGDVAILLSIALMFSAGSWDFYSMGGKMDKGLVSLIVCAGFTKSAQVPFSAWLPAAMAAPTPVSALVHSSTLVTAGVYLLIRFNDVIQNSGLSLMLLSFSTLTMFMAGLCAVFESDMKKVVALSTLSQLGLMVMVLSAGMKELAFFHLITHAMFKSSLFMCVGFMIHSSGGCQDSRQISELSLSSPLLGVMLGTTNLALCGFPFLAGFYSKDAVLEHLHLSSLNVSFVLLMVVGTGLTVAYSLRVLYLSVACVSAMKSVNGLSDIGFTVVKAMSFLFMASLLSGFFIFWAVSPIGSPSFLSTEQKYSIVLVSLMGGVVIYSVLSISGPVGPSHIKGVMLALGSMWFLSQLSTKVLVMGPTWAGLNNTKVVDSGWFEYYGGQGGSFLLLKGSNVLQAGQATPMVKSFMITVVLSFFFVVLI